MSRSDWLSKHNLTLVRRVTEVYWQGVRVPFTPAQVGLFTALLDGGIPTSSPGRKANTISVLISEMRYVMRKIGMPLTIKNYRGRREGGSYVLIESQPPSVLGVPEERKGTGHGRIYAASSSVSGLQGGTRGTRR